MPYIVNWDDPEKTLVRVDIVGNCTWDEYHIGINEVVKRLEEIPHTADVVLHEQGVLPSGNPIPHFQRAMRKLLEPGTFGKLYFVATSRPNTFFQAIGQMVMKMSGVDISSHDGGFYFSLDEVRAKSAAERKQP